MRQIRYNFQTSTDEQDEARHKWTFLIVNQPREIARIRQRIYEQFQPIVDIRENDRGTISKSRGLQYEVFSFSSPTSDFQDKSKIYDSPNFKRDRNLTDRSDEKLQSYLQKVLY